MDTDGDGRSESSVFTRGRKLQKRVFACVYRGFKEVSQFQLFFELGKAGLRFPKMKKGVETTKDAKDTKREGLVKSGWRRLVATGFG